MYKGGSKSIYDEIDRNLSNYDNVFNITFGNSFRHVKRNISVIYPLKYFNWLYRIFLEFIFVPICGIILRADKLIMLGNFPSPFWFKQQSVFFHNTLYLKKVSSGFKLKFESKLFSALIKIKRPTILVQTNLVKNMLHDRFGSALNIVVIGAPMNASTLQPVDFFGDRIVFFYPAMFYKHKNHILIFETWKRFEIKEFEIILTVDKPPGHNTMEIHCIGVISRRESIETLNRCTGLIFVSEEESLGLPLLEAVLLNKPIIAPNLPYVHSVISNFYQFEVDSPESLFNAINLLCGDLRHNRAKLAKSTVSISPEAFTESLLFNSIS